MRQPPNHPLLPQARPGRSFTACRAGGRDRLPPRGRLGRAVGWLVVAACTVVLLGGVHAPAGAAQLEPTTTLPATTQPPPTTLPATTLPPTTLPPTTRPATTRPATTLPAATTLPPTTPATARTATTRRSQVGRGPAPTSWTRPGAATPGPPGPAGAAPPGARRARPATGAPAPGPAVRQTPARDDPPLGGLRRLGRVVPVRLARQLVWTTVDELRRLPPAPRLVVVLLLSLCLALTALAAGRLWRVLRAWRTSPPPTGTGRLQPAAAPRRSFSLLVPARHEQAGLGETLSRLAASDHSDVEVLVVVGDDDPATTAVAQRAARRHPGRIRVLLDTSQPKNRPTALNTALLACRGEVVGVLDAEDEVHPQLLRHVDARFTDTGADLVQVRVQPMHHHPAWSAVHDVLKSHLWLGSRPHAHAQQRFIAPGGTIMFIRTALLREAGGWDPDCLAEDGELGVRLSSQGATVTVAADPGLVTREETPGTVRELLRQRTRRDQGIVQVLRKGEWRHLPTVRQRLLAGATLAMPLLQAGTGLLLGLSLAAMLPLRAPTLAAVLAVVPLVPMLLVLVAEAVGLAECCRTSGVRPRRRDYLRLALGMLPYHTLLAAAAVWAVARELGGHRGRTQTEHVGVHRAEPATPPGAGRPVARQHEVVRHPPRPHRATTGRVSLEVVAPPAGEAAAHLFEPPHPTALGAASTPDLVTPAGTPPATTTRTGPDQPDEGADSSCGDGLRGS